MRSRDITISTEESFPKMWWEDGVAPFFYRCSYRTTASRFINLHQFNYERMILIPHSQSKIWKPGNFF